MEFFRKKNGAVSVFLVIILVPMLVVTSLFVDVARLHLGQAMIDSAGDLTLNTAMTEFDEELNDYFGLLGTCKSDEELKKVSEDFYKNSLQSAGLSKSESDDFAKQVMAMFEQSTGEISDLMNLELVDNSFSMKGITNSGFNNPAVVKTQIVNFMKYRSPINGALHLLESLQKVSDTAGNSEEETELIAEKQEMAESEQTLMELLKTVYDNLSEYEKLSADNGRVIANTAGMKKIIKDINEYREKLYQYAEEAVINFLYLDISEAENFTPKPVKAGKAEKMSISKAFEEMDKILQEYKKKRDDLNKACTVNTGNELRDGLVKAVRVPDCYEEYKKTAKKLCDIYESMKDAFESVSDKGKTYGNTFETLGNKTFTYQETYDRFVALYQVCEKDFDKKANNDSCYYYKVLHNQVEGVGKAKLSELKTKYNKKKSELDGKINELASTYQKISDNVNDAVEKLEATVKALDEISGGKLNDFLGKKDTWKAHAAELKTKGSELGSTDVAMYEGAREKNGALTDAGIIRGIEENVTSQNVMKLRSHVNAIGSHLHEIKSKLERMKFGGDLVGKVSTVDKINEKFKSRISKEQFNQNLSDINALKNLVKTNFNELYKDTSGNLSSAWVEAAESTPVVSGDTIYKWLRDKVFKNAYKEDGKTNYDKYKEKSGKELTKDSEETKVDGLAEKYKVSNKKIKALKDGIKLPSAEITKPENKFANGKKSDDMRKASKTIQSFFSNIANAIKNMATGFRDDLYTVDYIMSMFSYDTFVNEGLYDVAKAMGKDVYTLTETRTAIQNKDVINAWSDESTVNTANKTLTNKEISQTNHYAFGNEVEYILHGGDNLGNKTIVDGTIFAIRFGFNSLYGFKEFWNDAAIVGAAAGISAATCGVVSPALVKLAIILALVVAETVYDISCLKAGMPVVIMKSNRSWQMQLSKVFGELADSTHSGSSGSTGSELSLRYSDYLKIFLMVSMTCENENKIYTRVADVIQCNMAKITSNDGYSMSKCRTWFTVSSRVFVKPLMLDLPWTKDAEGNPKDDTSWYTLSYSRSGGYY